MKRYIIKIYHENNAIRMEEIEMEHEPTSSLYFHLLDDVFNICRYAEVGIKNGVILVGDSSLLKKDLEISAYLINHDGSIYQWPLAGTMLIVKEIFKCGEGDLYGLTFEEMQKVKNYITSINLTNSYKNQYLLLPIRN